MIANTVAEFSREAARRYLQSAVFIDDNIYDRATATLAAPEVVEARRPKPAIFDDPAALESTPLPETRPEPDPPFRTQDLVGSFAKHGIVCAPYEPERNFDTDEKSTVFQLCETVDLVILDWDFHEVGLTGGKPKDLIARLVKQSNAVAPHHVRLIAIYTTTPRLGSISSAVFDYLEQQGIPVQPEDNDELRLQCGSTRLVILGKPGPGRKEGEMTHVVEEKDLANWLLKEFAAMNRGILPSCALLGMAAVRMNSRRILDKFSARLDGQFLFHRSLVREDGEAFDQLPELLADEIRAAMEDSDMLPIDLTSLVSSALEDIQVHTVAWKIQETPAADFLRKFIEQGDAAETKKVIGKIKDKKQEMAGMLSTPGGSEHLEFGELLSGRTNYRKGCRTLGFGTVVREILPMVTDGGGFPMSICLMPACDSIRLDLENAAAFPFWLLETDSKGHAQCVQTPEGSFLETVLCGKIRDNLWMEKFKPDATGKVNFVEDSGRQIIRTGARAFEWVAQLKPAHAQRLAHAVGQSFSRVGLTEAEWLRLAHA